MILVSINKTCEWCLKHQLIDQIRFDPDWSINHSHDSEFICCWSRDPGPCLTPPTSFTYTDQVSQQLDVYQYKVTDYWSIINDKLNNYDSFSHSWTSAAQFGFNKYICLIWNEFMRQIIDQYKLQSHEAHEDPLEPRVTRKTSFRGCCWCWEGESITTNDYWSLICETSKTNWSC